MKIHSTLVIAAWAVVLLCQWVSGQDDSTARKACLRNIRKNETAGTSGVIEKIISQDPSKKYFEIFDANNVYRYQIGLCNVVGENMAAVMQFNASNSDQKWSLGRLDAMHVIQQHDYAEIEYLKGDKYNSHCHATHRTVRIMFSCDPCGGTGTPVVVEEMTTLAKDNSNTHCFYLFEWPTKYACAPDHGYLVLCSAKGGTGAIIVLVLICLFIAYIAIGVIYKRCFLGAKGAEQFPNVDQWRMCGNLMADGCDCLCRRKRPEKLPYTSVLHQDELDMMEETDSEDDSKLLPIS